MINNIIIGENSHLTNSLIKSLKNKVIFSSNKFSQGSLNKIKSYKKINLIFNSFYPAKFLNNLTYRDYGSFEKLSIRILVDILKNIKPNRINKIIYTSSASVHRLLENIDTQKLDRFNRELYSSFKFSSEKIILNYCIKNKVDYFIFRLFNTYGDSKDNFSFIEKIIKSKKKNKTIKLINNGNSIRDFININDVGKIYRIVINKKIKSGIYDLGTGKGYLIKDIINSIKFPKSKILNVNNVSEIHNSIARNKELKKFLKNFKFDNLNNYLKKNLKSKKMDLKPVLNFENKIRPSGPTGIVIYGAGNAGKQIFHELQKNNEKILFFVDDNINLQNSHFNGVSIINFQNLLNIKKYYFVKRVYLAIPSLGKNSFNKIMSKLRKIFFDVRYLPEKKFLLTDKINIEDLKVNQVNDIINRKQIKIKKITKLNHKVILVTGATGTIGSEICRQLLQHKVKKIIAIDNSELGIYRYQSKLTDQRIKFKLVDVCDKLILEDIIKSNKVEIIFHASAYKHVNILEKNIFSAVKNNIFATENICNLSSKYSCELIFVSTDKAADPVSILGYTKKVAEKVCESFNRKNIIKNKIKIVRFGNVFGSSGSAINNFMDKINDEDIVQITNKKASRYFMTISEACHLVLQTTGIKSKKNIFILNMGQPINIFNLAKNLAKIKLNYNPNYKFKYEVTGLQPGEKLRETLKGKREVLKKLNNEIFEVTQNYQTKELFNLYYRNLVAKYNELNKKKLINYLKKISKY